MISVDVIKHSEAHLTSKNRSSKNTYNMVSSYRQTEEASFDDEDLERLV